MNDPQIWTMIAVFATLMLGGMTLMTTFINRTMSAGFRAVDAKFEAVNARFDSLEFRLEHLDRDVAAIARQVWGGGERHNDG
ncbi:MAG TPA: hypothetical protein PK781_00680 [Terrimesophilobacter sp.]|nr:hypothetical protein [Terrimesophilobacter sp.]HRP98956.1 hypothetical protein [Terrimesophilobacter sp.]